MSQGELASKPFHLFSFPSFSAVALVPCCTTTCSQRTENGISFTHLTSKDTSELDPESCTRSFFTYQQTESIKLSCPPPHTTPTCSHAMCWLLHLSIPGYPASTSVVVTFFFFELLSCFFLSQILIPWACFVCAFNLLCGIIIFS